TERCGERGARWREGRERRERWRERERERGGGRERQREREREGERERGEMERGERERERWREKESGAGWEKGRAFPRDLTGSDVTAECFARWTGKPIHVKLSTLSASAPLH